MFRQSIDCARQDAEWHKSSDGGKGKALLEYRIAKCLALGLGWVCYTDGSLDLAARLIDLARVLLTDKKAKMIRAYVDVVWAEVQMSEYGDQARHLCQAIETLKKAYNVFTSHPAYKARTAHILALAALRLSMLCVAPESGRHCREATRYIEEVKKYGERKKDRRWLANALIAESRLYRILRKYEAAQRAANLALGKSEGDPFVRIDALIELGEALLGTAGERGEQEDKKYRSALECFENVLRVSYENPKMHAVCHLHLARCYLKLHRGDMAVVHFKKWQNLTPRVRNAFVQHFGKEMEKDLECLNLPPRVELPSEASRLPDVAKEETWLRDWIRGTERALNSAV